LADNLGYTPGTGSTIATDDVGGNHFQRVKLTDGTPDSAAFIPGDTANGLDVDVTRVQGNVTVVQATATNLKVDASTVPVPVTDNGGTLSVDDGGGNLSVDDGGGSLTVDGTVTANQGSPNTNANAWPVKLTEGSNAAQLTNVSGSYALKVDVVQDVGASAQVDKSSFIEGSGRISVSGGVFNESIVSDPAEDQAAAFRITPKRAQHVNLRNVAGTEIGTASAPIRIDPTGTTPQPVSGTVTATLSATTNAGAAAKLLDLDTGAGVDNVAAFAIALPKSGGAVAGGTSADPIRVDPTGTTTQPISGTVTANQGGAPWSQNITQLAGHPIVTGANGLQRVGIVGASGTVFSDTAPLPVTSSGNLNRTVVRNAVAYTASQTDVSLLTPTGGKRIVVESILLKVSGGGVLQIFGNTNSPSKMLVDGNFAVDDLIQIQFPNGHPLDAVNDVLRYTSGAGAAGRITVFGYEV
jgi:hypothetical protein